MYDKPGGMDVVEGHGIMNFSFEFGEGKGVFERDEMGVNVTVVARLLMES